MNCGEKAKLVAVLGFCLFVYVLYGITFRVQDWGSATLVGGLHQNHGISALNLLPTHSQAIAQALSTSVFLSAKGWGVFQCQL